MFQCYSKDRQFSGREILHGSSPEHLPNTKRHGVILSSEHFQELPEVIARAKAGVISEERPRTKPGRKPVSNASAQVCTLVALPWYRRLVMWMCHWCLLLSWCFHLSCVLFILTAICGRRWTKWRHCRLWRAKFKPILWEVCTQWGCARTWASACAPPWGDFGWNFKRSEYGVEGDDIPHLHRTERTLSVKLRGWLKNGCYSCFGYSTQISLDSLVLPGIPNQIHQAGTRSDTSARTRQWLWTVSFCRKIRWPVPRSVQGRVLQRRMKLLLPCLERKGKVQNRATSICSAPHSQLFSLLGPGVWVAKNARHILQRQKLNGAVLCPRNDQFTVLKNFVWNRLWASSRWLASSHFEEHWEGMRFFFCFTIDFWNFWSFWKHVSRCFQVFFVNRHNGATQLELPQGPAVT